MDNGLGFLLSVLGVSAVGIAYYNSNKTPKTPSGLNLTNPNFNQNLQNYTAQTFPGIDANNVLFPTVRTPNITDNLNPYFQTLSALNPLVPNPLATPQSSVGGTLVNEPQAQPYYKASPSDNAGIETISSAGVSPGSPADKQMYTQAFQHILSVEGQTYKGWTKPAGAISWDPPTKYGITDASGTDPSGKPTNFPAWRNYLKSTGQAYRPVSTATLQDAANFYYKTLWLPNKLYNYSYPLAEAFLDVATNSGTPTAQKLLGQSGGDYNKFLQLRKKQYQSYPNFNVYAHSWLSRLNQLANNAVTYFKAHNIQATVVNPITNAVTHIIPHPSGVPVVNSSGPSQASLPQGIDIASLPDLTAGVPSVNVPDISGVFPVATDPIDTPQNSTDYPNTEPDFSNLSPDVQISTDAQIVS